MLLLVISRIFCYILTGFADILTSDFVSVNYLKIIHTYTIYLVNLFIRDLD